jgi:hypothetical protein
MFYLRSVRLYLQLFVGGLMFYLRSVRLYLQLFVGGQHEPSYKQLEVKTN